MSSTKQGLSMTMAALAFNCQSGRAYYVNAGHTPLIVKQGEKISLLLEPSCPLGIKLDLQYQCQSFDLSEKFSVFLYTDGLTENEGTNGKVIKLKSITKMMKESEHVQEFYESLNQMTSSYWQNTILNDDVSFVMIEWNPYQPISQTNRSA
jgi:serine phosphatase RsbU (regulator of sigma subunit)